MAVSFSKVNSFVEAMAHGKHNLATASDVLTVALCNAANPPDAGDAVLADLVTIAYTNLSSRVLSISGSVQAGGVFKLSITDIDLTASGGSVATFRYVVLYNETATNDEIIGFYDKGSDVSLGDGEKLTLDFDDANGVLTNQ